MESLDAEVVMLEFVQHQSVAAEADQPEWERFKKWLYSTHPEIGALWAILWATSEMDGPGMNMMVNRVVYR